MTPNAFLFCFNICAVCSREIVVVYHTLLVLKYSDVLTKSIKMGFIFDFECIHSNGSLSLIPMQQIVCIPVLFEHVTAAGTNPSPVVLLTLRTLEQFAQTMTCSDSGI